MINFGPKAAQDDNQLLEYFHQTDQIETSFIKKKDIKGFIFVTRSGCGKTALVKWLNCKELQREKIYLSPSRFSLVCDDDSLSLENYKNIITVELFLGIIDEFKEKLFDEDLRKECDKLIRGDWYEKIKNFFKSNFSGISILGNGFNLNESQRKEYLDLIKRTNKIELAGELLEKVSSQLDIILIVDNPEYIVAKGLDEVDENNSKRIGAFFSVLNNINNRNVQVAAFTKEYILQSVKKAYIDFNHFSDNIIGLEWAESDLVQLIENRVNKRLKKQWDQVFSFTQKTFVKEILPNLINGPRDLIDICNSAGRDTSKITLESCEGEFQRLRNDKWNEIEVQYNRQWEHLGVFCKYVIEILLKNNLMEFERSDFEKLLKKQFETANSTLGKLRAKADWIYYAKWKLDEYLELFFLIGLLGYRNKGKSFYTWQGRSIEEFKKSDKYFISPLFIE